MLTCATYAILVKSELFINDNMNKRMNEFDYFLKKYLFCSKYVPTQLSEVWSGVPYSHPFIRLNVIIKEVTFK